MVGSLRSNTWFQQLEAEHRKWLSDFNGQYLRNWERIVNQNEEAALAEARFRQLLESWNIRVEPNEDLHENSSRPDFCCHADDNKFYVEVTCITREVATAKTGRPVVPVSGRMYVVNPSTDAVWAKCQGRKASQCSNLDAPAILAIGTFHDSVATEWDKTAANWVLTGEQKITLGINRQTGEVGDTYQSTELHSAAFLRPDENEEIGFARNSISGLLLCGFSLTHLPIGVLHPNPARPFDPRLLPQIEFGRVAIDKTSRKLRVDWPEGDD